MWTEIAIAPMGKPRMNRSVKWNPTVASEKYFAFKDELVMRTNLAGIYDKLRGSGVLGVQFVIPMASSWSKKKKASHDGQPHQQKPDLDNCIKAVKDCLMEEDSHVWRYEPCPQKTWGYEGKILFWIEK